MPQGELRSRIRESLLGLPQFQEASIDVHLIGDDGFVVFGEDAQGVSLPLRSGFIRFLDDSVPTVTWTEEHTMTDEQAHIYQRALRHVSKKVIEGRERGDSRIMLMDSSAFPEIFEDFTAEKTLQEVLKPENAAVWWNVENSLKLWGYDDVLAPGDSSEAAMLWAEPIEQRDPPA